MKANKAVKRAAKPKVASAPKPKKPIKSKPDTGKKGKVKSKQPITFTMGQRVVTVR